MKSSSPQPPNVTQPPNPADQLCSTRENRPKFPLCDLRRDRGTRPTIVNDLKDRPPRPAVGQNTTTETLPLTGD
jgi:hypothetical protein